MRYKYYETRYGDTMLGNGNADSIVGSSQLEKHGIIMTKSLIHLAMDFPIQPFPQTLDGVEYDETTDTYNVKSYRDKYW